MTNEILHCSCGAACTPEQYQVHVALGHDQGQVTTCSMCQRGEDCGVHPSTDVTGEVKEYHFKCDELGHQFSVLTKGTKDEVVLGFECLITGCLGTAQLLGENDAEVSKNPVDLLEH